VAVLLAAGADPDIYADDGSGPLHWAVQNGHAAVVEQLLGHGANPSAMRDTGYSVLAAAIDKGNVETVRRLVEAGAAVEHRYFNRSMSEYAKYCRQPEIATLLRRWRRTRPTKPHAAPDPAT
jgi:ankyrin repeat protein